MAEWGFGIIGCGMIAHYHAKAIAALPAGKLVAVQTSNPDKAVSVVADAGSAPETVAVHTDLSAFLAQPGLDIVCICTPSGAHLEPAVAAAQAGKHVVVEKPLEITLQRCDQIIDACDRANVRLCTIFPSRFSPVNQHLREAIRAGRFGRMSMADTTVKWWREQRYYDSGGWRGTWALDGGGALMNQAIHNVDLLQSLAGPVRSVAAFTALLAHERIEVEDAAVAALRFANGALGVIQASTAIYPGLLKTIAVHGDQGSVVVEQDHLLTWHFANALPEDEQIRQEFGKQRETTGGASDPKAISFVGHQKQLQDLIDSIEQNRPPLVDGAEGRKSVEIILAIYKSQQTGQIVEL